MQAADQLGVLAHPAAEDAPGVTLQGRDVPIGRGATEAQEDVGSARDAQCSGSGGHQDEPIDPLRVGVRELLGHRTTQAHTEHVRPANAYSGEHTRRETGEAPNAVGTSRQFGAADARGVEGERTIFQVPPIGSFTSTAIGAAL